MRVIGPTGNPNRVMARSIASIDVPSTRSQAASLMYGARIRFTQKPGLSRSTITVLPMARPNFTAVAVAQDAVWLPGMTSSKGIFSAGEKKCTPRTRSGWVAWA